MSSFPGLYQQKNGYYRVKRRGEHRDRMAHRVYMERCIGRPLRSNEEVHHLCKNTACWPPTDFHLVLMDFCIHREIEKGRNRDAKGRYRGNGAKRNNYL